MTPAKWVCYIIKNICDVSSVIYRWLLKKYLMSREFRLFNIHTLTWMFLLTSTDYKIDGIFSLRSGAQFNLVKWHTDFNEWTVPVSRHFFCDNINLTYSLVNESVTNRPEVHPPTKTICGSKSSPSTFATAVSIVVCKSTILINLAKTVLLAYQLRGFAHERFPRRIVSVNVRNSYILRSALIALSTFGCKGSMDKPLVLAKACGQTGTNSPALINMC
jgi:hypothetical protein